MQHHSEQLLPPSVEEMAIAFETTMGWHNFRDGEGGKNIFKFLYSSAQMCVADEILLDVSAGQCRYKPFFNHCHYVAIDSMVGDDTWDFSHLDLIGNALNLPIKSASIDGCLNFTSLEHYPEPAQAFQEFYRVLKPGGRLFLYVPFVQDEHQIPYDFFRYTRYGLAHLCEQSGFVIETLMPINGIFETVLSWLKIAIRYTPQSNQFQLMQVVEQYLEPAFKLAEQHPATRVEYPAEPSFPQMTSAYCLRARKPGESDRSPRFQSQEALVKSLAICPHCKQEDALHWQGDHLSCGACGKTYGFQGTIPVLL